MSSKLYYFLQNIGERVKFIMQKTKILEMLNDNRIEELKQKLRDAIYADVLKTKPGANKRYLAMKKYFKHVVSEREFLKKPCIVEFQGDTYTSFCNSYSLALTKEPCGAIELFTDRDRYPNVARLIHREGRERKIDFKRAIAEAKVEGYSLTKNEAYGPRFKFLLLFENAYFRLGLVDVTYSIIDDGEPAIVHIGDTDRSPITIETSIGICVVMPVTIKDNENDYYIIEVEEVEE